MLLIDVRGQGCRASDDSTSPTDCILQAQLRGPKSRDSLSCMVVIAISTVQPSRMLESLEADLTIGHDMRDMHQTWLPDLVFG